MRLLLVRNILLMLGGNIIEGLDSTEDAHRFVQKMDDLSEDERLFLQSVLEDPDVLLSAAQQLMRSMALSRFGDPCRGEPGSHEYLQPPSLS